MSYRDFLVELKKGMPASAYLLSSSDPFLHSEAASSIKALVPAAERDFNFQVFDLIANGTTPLDQILDVANTVPFFSGRKFVVVENLQKIVKKDLAKLGQYLATPSASSALILLYAGQAKKETKDALKAARQIVLDISERDIHGWLRDRARAKGVALSDRAADYLLGIIGPDLGLLSSELDKCALMGKDAVDVDDVMEVAEGKRTFNVFALTDALRSGDPEQVFRIYRVLRETEEPYGLLGALNWQYARSFGERNSPRDRDYYHRIFTMLKEADLQIKSSGGAYPLELLLTKLMQVSRQR
ncbi:MAG: DNA polymerase III subunit delta [Nitrospiraceae bacterium]|nr:DNA polymerase III subunit delta [Nitrospiraceae bacterium]